MNTIMKLILSVVVLMSLGRAYAAVPALEVLKASVAEADIHKVAAAPAPTAGKAVMFEDDMSFVQVGIDFWWNNLLEMGAPPLSKDFLENARASLQGYKAGTIPELLNNFPHSANGQAALVYCIEKIMTVCEAAGKAAPVTDNLVQLMEREFIGIRYAIGKSANFKELAANIDASSAAAIKDVQNNGLASGTSAELQYVYLFRYNWEDAVIQSENASALTTKQAYINTAVKALAEVKKNMGPGAPSKRAYETAVYVQENVIEILKGADRCSKNLDGFLMLSGNYLGIYKEDVDSAMVNEKSLDAIRKAAQASYTKITKGMQCL